MSFSGYLYAIALGFDVPLASLQNVQQLLYPYNRVAANSATQAVPVVSEPVNFTPIRLPDLDGQESRDGITYHAWRMALNTGGINFWLNTFFPAAVASVTGEISVAVTIYTRMAPFANYTRQNCYMIYPTMGEGGDLIYAHKRGLFYLSQRFNDLLESAP